MKAFRRPSPQGPSSTSARTSQGPDLDAEVAGGPGAAAALQDSRGNQAATDLARADGEMAPKPTGNRAAGQGRDAGRDTNTSLSVDHLRPLPGGLDKRPLIVSNNPEMFTSPGYLLRTSGALPGRGDITHTFDQGFDLYVHHLNKVEGHRSVDFVIVLKNPSGKPVTVDMNGALRMTNDRGAGWGMGKESFGGPNAVAADGAMTADPKKGYQQQSLTLAPGQSVEAVVHPVRFGAEVDGRYVVNANGPVQCDVKVNAGTPAAGGGKATEGAAEGHMASTAPGALGRASGVYSGARWSYSGGPIDIPEMGQAAGYLVSGTKYQQKIQQQAPQAIERYPDSSQGVEGCYGVQYDLDFPLRNPTAQARKVQVAFTAPHKEGEKQPPSFHWMGPIRVNGKVIRARVNELGDGVILGTWDLAPGAVQDVHLDFLTPGDITAPEALEIRTVG